MADDLVSTLYAPDAGQEPLLALPDVSILKTAPLARLSFRGRDGALAAAGKGFGVVLPTTPLSAEIGTDRAAFWLGPDEWLLIAQEDLLSDTMEGLAS
ncbi:MAG: sarcosine oxidase subunit gamma, partial [Roseibium sp.]